MRIYSLKGTKVSIGTTKDVDFTSSTTAKTDFAADAYQKIAKCETLSDFGDQNDDVTFTDLEEGRTVHMKASVDGGLAEITMANLPDDEGQAAVLAASQVDDEYNLRFEWPNGYVAYLRGPIYDFQHVNGTGPGNVMKRKWRIANNYGEIVVAPAG